MLGDGSIQKATEEVTEYFYREYFEHWSGRHLGLRLVESWVETEEERVKHSRDFCEELLQNRDSWNASRSHSVLLRALLPLFESSLEVGNQLARGLREM